jgi:hypothetical protein
MAYGAQNHPTWQNETDPHRRMRERYGNGLHAAVSAMTGTSFLIHSCWPHFDRATGVCMIEIRWARPTTPEERSAVAKGAAEALRTWLGPEAESWVIRAKNAKRLPLLKTSLPPADEGDPGWG